MKKFYLLLNIIFLVTAVLLLRTYSQRLETATTDAGKKIRQKKPGTVEKLSSRPVHTVSPGHEDYTAILADSKLFQTDRGEEPVAVEGKKAKRDDRKCNFKLMGICHFGNQKGAIIVSTNLRHKPSDKTFFTIGEAISDGYKLYDVTAKTAILRNGRDNLELELAKVESRKTPNIRRPRVADSNAGPVNIRRPVAANSRSGAVSSRNNVPRPGPAGSPPAGAAGNNRRQ
ncbi:MAG: hypothetical protein PHV59_03090 [Victivallales bacterium]|nr:hypothetical protein [Victivallales bacterium]